MTYRELLRALIELSDEQLSMNVSVYSEALDEFTKVSDFSFTVGDDVLCDDHPILIFG